MARPNPAESNRYEDQIRRVLDLLLEPSFKLKNDVYLNTLYLNVVKDADGAEACLWDPHIYIGWLERALDVWKAGPKPPISVQIFALNLATFLIQTEDNYNKLDNFKCVDNLINVFLLNQPEITQSLKHGYIKLLAACLSHNSGFTYIISNPNWIDVLQFALSNQTLYITQEGFKFLAELLRKSASKDELFCLKMVEMLLKPLKDNSRFVMENMNSFEINEEHIMRSLMSTLQLLSMVFELVLESNHTMNDLRVLRMFVYKDELENILLNYLSMAQTKEFSFAVSKLLHMVHFVHITVEIRKSAIKENCRPYVAKMYKILSTNIQKGFCENVIKLCHMGTKCNKEVVRCMPIAKMPEDAAFRFEHQMMLVEMMPVIIAGFRLSEKKYSAWDEQDDLRQLFADKIFKLISNTTMRCIFEWRAFLFQTPQIFYDSCLSMNYILKSRQYYCRETGITAFQCLIYCLHDVMFCIKEKPDRLPVITNEVHFLSLLLECIAVFIEQFDLTWKDSVETICVMNVSFDFLSMPTWPPQLVVKAMKLMEIAISKYMAPNLALLVDRTNDSTMAFISPLLTAKMHDPSWEVRDSALEILYTIASNAATKFPSFRQLIQESTLPSLVVTMATQDSDTFVRMTAVRCLQQMIIVRELFSETELQNLHDCMLRYILIETEGIVRKELVTLVSKTYENQLFPNNYIECVYDMMCHAVIGDLHWEVKVNGLNFWEQVIKLHLQNQGMIDNIFPRQTFSKEHRKIMTLTDDEIQKRLIKVLHQLSLTGCLGVLISAIKDDCDLEVSKNAIRLTTPFLDLLKRYGVNCGNIVLSTPPSPLYGNGPSSPSSGIFSPSFNSPEPEPYSPMPEFSEEVLEEILDSRDVNLLRAVYNEENRPVNNSIPLRKRPIVTPKEFLEFTGQDLQIIIEERQQWIKSIDNLGSLLNDILKEYHNGDVNTMDCY